MEKRIILAVALLACLACSGKKNAGEDADRDPDAPSDVVETTDPAVEADDPFDDPDVAADEGEEPDVEEDVTEDVPEDVEDEDAGPSCPAPLLSDDLRLTNDTAHSEFPSIAWSGSTFGVSWQDERDGNAEIYFTLVSSAGVKIGSDVRITDDSGSSQSPSMVWAGSTFGLAWHDDRDGNDEIYFALVSASGTKVGSDVRVTDAANISWSSSLAWTGSEYGVAWWDARSGAREVYFARLDASGTRIGSDLLVAAGAQPSLTWTGSEFGVTWEAETGGNVLFCRISATGSKEGSETTVTTSTATHSSLTWARGTYGVTWQESEDGNPEIYFGTLSPTGTRIGTDTRITYDLDDSRQPALAVSDDGFGVAWMDNRPGNDEIFFATVSSAGTLVGSDVRITRARLASAAASLVWAGSAFGLAWKDSRDLNSEIYFNLIAPCP